MKVSRSEPGFVVSSVVHAGLLLAALVVFSDTAKYEDVVETPVDVVSEMEPARTPKGEKIAREKAPKPRVDRIAKESETKPHPPLREAKKDTPAPPPPLRRLTDPGEDASPPAPPKRMAALPPAPEPKPEPPRRSEPKPEPRKAEPKPEPRPEPKAQARPVQTQPVQAKPAPAPPVKAKAAPEKEEDEPKEAEVVKPKPPVKPKPEPSKEPPAPKPEKTARETPKEAPREAPKEPSKDAMKELVRDAAKEPSKTDPIRTGSTKAAAPKTESRLKADEVAKLLASKKLDDKSSEGEEADKSAKASKPKSGDESAPKSKFDASSISKMLSRESPQRRAATGEKTQLAALGAESGSAPKLTASMEARIASYIHDHYHPCWASALSLGGATFAPVVEFHLSRDGALEGSPRLVNGSSDPVERARGEQAVQAVRRCSPMRIPPEFAPFYEEALREVTIRFQDAN